MFIATTNERWLIGKITDQNHPFDIWMAPENRVMRQGKNIQIYSGVHIQTKRLVSYPPKRLMGREWVSKVEELIKEKLTNTDFGLNGHLHFYNCISLDESQSVEELKSLLGAMYVPHNKHVDSISISIALQNSLSENTVVTWYVYPRVMPFQGVLNLDDTRAKLVYIDRAIKEMLTSAYIEKMKI